MELVGSIDPDHSRSAAVRALFALRWKIGGLLSWDGPDAGVGSRCRRCATGSRRTCRTARRPRPEALPFVPLYLTDDEWAAEVANRTVHGVLHIGKVPDGSGGFRAQMAVLVKPNGILGSAYLVAIKPFRYLIVYPALLREVGEQWASARRQSER